MAGFKEYVRTVTTKGQVTIPAEIRRALNVHPGDKVIFRIGDDVVELEPVAMSLEDTFGAVSPIQQPEDFDSLRETAIEEHVQNIVDEMNQ